ncbi:DUF5994 family protein [Nocardioides sp. MAHUQ-72]|uniref:DUF5994 family protein n=1 Tax=unclassified Nocardioides TaxID=2615069 RepID=UPI00361514BF
MTTSYATTPIDTLTDTDAPLRLELADELGHGPLDGAWWPRSDDLQREVADLVDHFPAGRVDHLVYSRPDWADVARRVTTRRGSIKIGSFPRDDTHVVLVNLATRRVVRLLVIPAATETASANLMMHRAAEAGNQADAAELLRSVADEHTAVDEVWSDDGGNYWGPDPVAPSHR